MQYKGDDLDLRVPHARTPRETYVPDYEPPAGNGRWARAQHSASSSSTEPLWVDEVLLACCNYAFDVAQANGAAEVGLDHLVNALTRVDAAARALESRGVREGQLRRDSAALIASEIPAANAGEAVVPRRSPELEDVLRRSADIAHRRGAPAGVEDALWVLLHYNRDAPVLQLLRRMAPDWQRADWSRVREFATPEPAASRPVQLVTNDGTQARMGNIEDSLRLMQAEFAIERKTLMDLVRDIQRDVVAQRGDGAAFRGDLGQRLETIERAVQMRGDSSRTSIQIAERLAGLEKAVHGGLGEALRGTAQLGQRLTTLELTLGDNRGGAGQQAIADRMATLEKAVHGGLGEGARNWSHLGQRLAALETALGDRRDSGTVETLAERLSHLERSIQAGLADATRSSGQLVQRLAGFERLVSENGAARIPESLTSRLTQIEKRLETVGEDNQLQWADIGERLAEFARLIEVGRTDDGRAPTEVAERLKGIESRLSSGTGESAPVVREFAERIAGLERAVRAGFGDAAQTTNNLLERLQLVERGLERGPTERPGGDDGEALLVLDDRLGSIERMLDTRGQQAISVSAEIVERLRILEQRPASQGAIDVAGLVSPLASQFESLEGNNASRAEALHSSLGDITVRLTALEERMRAEALVTEEALRGRDQDFDFIYNEIKQLGQSQTTLNSAVNDWRNESQTHFGTLAGRLDKWPMAPSVTAAAVEPPAAPSVPFELPTVVKGRNGAEPAVNGANRSGAVASKARLDRTVLEKASAEGVRADDYTLPPQPGRGFWYWLFGTGNVVRANRENDLKIGRMRQNIQDARERRRTQA